MGLADCVAGLDPEFLDEAGAQVAVDGQGLRLAAGAVQDEHELAVVCLTQRMLGDQRRQLRDEPGRPGTAEGEFGVVPPLQQEQPCLLQALHEGVAAEVGGEAAERCAAPEREPGRAGAHDDRPVPPGVRGTRLDDPGVEHVHVQLAVVDPQQIAGRYGPEPLGVVQETAQPGDVVVQRGLRRDGGCPAPQDVLQGLHRHHPAGLQQQRGEQGTHLGAADGVHEVVGGGVVGVTRFRVTEFRVTGLQGDAAGGARRGSPGGVVRNTVRRSVVEDGRPQESETQLASPHHAATAFPRSCPTVLCGRAPAVPWRNSAPSSTVSRRMPAGRGRTPLGSGLLPPPPDGFRPTGSRPAEEPLATC